MFVPSPATGPCRSDRGPHEPTRKSSPGSTFSTAGAAHEGNTAPPPHHSWLKPRTVREEREHVAGRRRDDQPPSASVQRRKVRGRIDRLSGARWRIARIVRAEFGPRRPPPAPSRSTLVINHEVRPGGWPPHWPPPRLEGGRARFGPVPWTRLQRVHPRLQIFTQDHHSLAWPWDQTRPHVGLARPFAAVTSFAPDYLLRVAGSPLAGGRGLHPDTSFSRWTLSGRCGLFRVDVSDGGSLGRAGATGHLLPGISFVKYPRPPVLSPRQAAATWRPFARDAWVRTGKACAAASSPPPPPSLVSSADMARGPIEGGRPSRRKTRSPVACGRAPPPPESTGRHQDTQRPRPSADPDAPPDSPPAPATGCRFTVDAQPVSGGAAPAPFARLDLPTAPRRPRAGALAARLRRAKPDARARPAAPSSIVIDVGRPGQLLQDTRHPLLVSSFVPAKRPLGHHGWRNSAGTRPRTHWK